MKKLAALLLAILIAGTSLVLPALAAPSINWHTPPVYPYEGIEIPISNKYQDIWIVSLDKKANKHWIELEHSGLMRSDGSIVLEPKHVIYNLFNSLYRHENDTYADRHEKETFAYALDENGKDGDWIQPGFGDTFLSDHYYDLSSKTLYYGVPHYDYPYTKKVVPTPNDVFVVNVMNHFVIEGDVHSNYDEGNFLGKAIFAKGGIISGSDYSRDFKLLYSDKTDYNKALISVKNDQGKYGVVKYDMSLVYPYEFDKISIFTTKHQLAAVQAGGLWGFVSLPWVTSKRALPSNANVLVSDSAQRFDAYNIEDNNYFKLRDLASVLSDSEKQFNVSWDAQKGSIDIQSRKAYTPVGGELLSGDGKAKTAAQSTAKIFLDGKEVSLNAYTINDNNYFKLRDVCKLLDVGVKWDATSSSIAIEPNASYTD